MRCFICTVFYASLLVSSHGAVEAQQDGKLQMMQDVPLDKSRASVKFREGILAREIDLHAKGVSSEINVEFARIWLAKARHDLALHENKIEDAIDQTRLIVKVREKQMKRMKQLSDNGLASEFEVNEAQRHLACARYFLGSEERKPQDVAEQLQLIVDLCKKELKHLEKLRAQAISSWQVHRAESRLISAQYLLAKTASNPEELIKELRRHVEVCEKEWKQVMDLKRSGAAMVIETYAVRVNLLNAKLRLANVEKNTEVIVEQLRALVKLHEETLPQVRGMNNPELERHFKDWVISGLGLDKLRLEKVLGGNPYIDDLAAAEIDS
jgi:hypothetical protein